MAQTAQRSDSGSGTWPEAFAGEGIGAALTLTNRADPATSRQEPRPSRKPRAATPADPTPNRMLLICLDVESRTWPWVGGLGLASGCAGAATGPHGGTRPLACGWGLRFFGKNLAVPASVACDGLREAHPALVTRCLGTAFILWGLVIRKSQGAADVDVEPGSFRVVRTRPHA